MITAPSSAHAGAGSAGVAAIPAGQSSWRNRFPWVTLTIGLLITGAVTLQMKNNVEKIASLSFTSRCDAMQSKIIDRFDDYARLLQGGAAFFNASEKVTREQWRIFSRDQKFEKQLPGIQGIGFALLIPRKTLPRHLREIRHEGFPGYTIKPAGERELYTSIIYLEPFPGRNLRAFGYDMFSEPVRRSAMEQARDTGGAALSGKVVLVQESGVDVQPGILMYLPVYRKGMPVDTVAGRRAALRGWVYSPYRMNDLMQGILLPPASKVEEQLNLQLFDGMRPSPGRLLHGSPPPAKGMFRNDEQSTRQIQLKGRLWTLCFTQSSGGFFSTQYLSAWLTMVGGAALTILLMALSAALRNTRLRAARIAEELTNDLKESEQFTTNVMDSLSSNIAVLDAGGIIVAVNESWRTFAAENGASGGMISDIGKQYLATRSSNGEDDEGAAAALHGIRSVLSGEQDKFSMEYPCDSRESRRWFVMQASRLRGSRQGGVVIHTDITLEKKLATEIQDAREYAENIVETVRLPLVVLNGDLRILTANQSFYVTFKVTPEETIGSYIHDLGNRQWDIPELRTLFEEILPQKTLFYDYKVEHDFPTIGHKTILLNAREIFREAVGSHIILLAMEDITELKQREQELLSSEAKFRQLHESLMDAFIKTNLHGEIIESNQVFREMVGYSPQELARLSYQVLTPDKWHAADTRIVDEQILPRGYSDVYEKEYVTKDGRVIPVELRGFLLRNPYGKPEAMWAILRDISERKRVSAVLAKQAAQLRQEIVERNNIQELLQKEQQLLEALNRDLEERVAAEVQKSREKDRAHMQNEKMATLGQLAAGVAHEINNPMGYISSNLRLLFDYFERISKLDRIIQENCFSRSDCPAREVVIAGKKALDMEYILTDGAELITESLSGAEQVKKIVLGLKNFSRMDTEEKQPMTLNSCLERALIIVHNELKYVATVREEYSPVPEILCYPGQLNQVFLNLLVNAGQAMTVPGEIIMKCWHDNTFVYASVSDTGSGIPKELREKIFDPFFTTKEVNKGTGLGLSISHEIIKKHGGELTVKSAMGIGTTFTVKLPLNQGEET